MKLNKILLGVTTMLVALIFCGTIEVKAEKYTGQAIWPSEFIDNYYIKKERSDGYIKYQQARFIRRSEDNKFVYCLQPYVEIDNTHVYNVARSDYASVLNMSEEQWQRVSLLAYYGYGYEGHSTHKWYALTQVMIWETVEPTSKIYFTNSLNGTRNDSILASERAELENLVARHNTRPSISIENNTVAMGNTITVTDANNVLSDYAVTSSNNLEVTKNGNQLTIKPTGIGDATITFKKTATKYDSNPVVYYASGTQNVMRVGNYDPINVSIKLKVIGGKLTIHKLDRDTGNNTPLGEGSLENAVYGIYDMAGNLITKITTDSLGEATSDYLPYIGSYILKEISNSKGYELDPKEYTFEISEDILNPTITVYEQVVKRNIKIHKYIANGETGNLIPEESAVFEFYDRNNKKVATVTTDSEGFATLNLPYGTYKGKQTYAPEGLEVVQDFEITINENSPEVIHLSFSNAPVTAKLKLIKIDYDSGKVIPFAGVTFKIKNVSTGEYVCQKVTYPEKKDICEFSTNESGEFITPYPLVSNTYRIEEITSPSGYLLNEESIEFRLDQDSDLIIDNDYGKYLEVEFANKKIKGEIQIVKTGEKFKADNGSFSYDEVPLEGIEFSIYADEDIITLDGVKHYSKGDLIKTITTDINGQAILSDLYLGKYIIKETKTLDNYVLDTEVYSVELTEKDNKTPIVTEKLELSNKLKKSDLEFTKTDLVTGDVIPNTLIEIYTENNELIYSGKTDDEGKIIITGLSIGKYFIIEKECVTGYVLNTEKVFFEILEDGKIVKASMTNKPITGSLEFTKIDFSTGEPIPNTLIEIYKETDTEPELIFSGLTDENGQIIIDELYYGRYFILEKETASPDYILNTEKMYFEILEDGQIIKSTMVNEKVIVEVPSTDSHDYYIVEILGSILIISGIGVAIYVLKKKKK